MIRNCDNGEFIARTGISPQWGVKGKMFKQRNHATAHIKANERWYAQSHAELVEFEMNPVELGVIPVLDVIKSSNERKRQEVERREESWKKLEYLRAKAIVKNFEETK